MFRQSSSLCFSIRLCCVHERESERAREKRRDIESVNARLECTVVWSFDGTICCFDDFSFVVVVFFFAFSPRFSLSRLKRYDFMPILLLSTFEMV